MALTKKNYMPAAFVAAAALLWGTDLVARYPTSLRIDYKVLVLMEHLVGFIFVAPYVLWRRFDELRKISLRDLGLVAVIGMGGSAIGNLLITASVQKIGPSGAMLFQMIQPLCVIALAYFFLRERPSPFFVQMAFWVVFSAIVMAFPDFSFGFLRQDGDLEPRPLFFGLSAMAIWAVSTVSGKSLLNRYSPETVVFFRWSGAVVGLLGLLIAQRTPVDWSAFGSFSVLGPLLFLGTMAGVLAMGLYYHGLKRLPASLTTFIELLYPLAGVVLPALYFGNALHPFQALAAVVLIGSLALLVGLEYQVEK